MLRKPSRAIPLACALFAMTITGFCQGSLTPPGAPAPSMKTLDQIEARTPIESLPFTITNSGAYYLTSNLTYSGVGHGIIVNQSDVTIDLNGFGLIGNAGASNAIYVATSVNNFSVRNGSIRVWKLGLNATNNASGIFSDLLLMNCTAGGLTSGNGSIVERCTAISISGYGISTGNGSIIRNCIAQLCSAGGINVNPGSSVQHCTLTQNTGTGITTGSACSVKDCTLLNNSGIAISTAGSCTICSCNIANNFNIGISTANSTVEECSISNNSGGGVIAGANMKVLNNNLFSNGGPGNLQITGNYGRIEGNHSTGGGRGFKIDGLANLVIRNSAGGNSTNYSIVANNIAGPFVTSSANLATNSNPHANYDF
jgi:hypothetical protein